VESNDTNTTHNFELTVILYTVSQSADPQLWDGNFCPISIFGMNEYFEGNVKNITYSPHRIMAFIRQWKLEDKTAEDISQILEFNFVA